MRRLLVVQAAGLGHELVAAHPGIDWGGLEFRALPPVFPALTCVAQASFRTGLAVGRHGVVGNGWLFRELGRPLFWEQSARLVGGPRFWHRLRDRGGRVAMLFWQQSLGESVDAVLSPAPIHKHGGGMIDSCYSRPEALYPRLCEQVGRSFRLVRYWGPLASTSASDWIAAATAALMEEEADAPDLCLTYLPALDYDLQRYGPGHPRSVRALHALAGELRMVGRAAERRGYEMLVFGDYAVGAVPGGAAFPNRALHAEGLLRLRRVRGMTYPDLHHSRAFAVVDHEIAHVYAAPDCLGAVRAVLARLGGVEQVLDRAGQEALGVGHPRSGDLMLVAREGHWLAYPWWESAREAPDYARHVDIHNKPGYDPCELFLGWPPLSTSTDCSRIRGSHGRAGPGRDACWAATWPVGTCPRSLAELARLAGDRLEEAA